MKKRLLLTGIFVLLFSTAAFSQTPAPPQQQNQTKNQTSVTPDENNSDLVITANVRAKELRFEVVPTPTVEFSGKPERKTVWEADRTNLPQQVQPGVTYRDIGVRLRIYSRFAEIQRIALEAIDDENAGSQESQPQNTPQTTQGTQQKVSSNTTAARAPVSSAAKQKRAARKR